MELASRDRLYENPLHPYTKALLSAVPIPDPTLKRERIILKEMYLTQPIPQKDVNSTRVVLLLRIFVAWKYLNLGK